MGVCYYLLVHPRPFDPGFDWWSIRRRRYHRRLPPRSGRGATRRRASTGELNRPGANDGAWAWPVCPVAEGVRNRSLGPK